MYLGIDVGTTALKAIVVDDDQKTVEARISEGARAQSGPGGLTRIIHRGRDPYPG